MIKKFTPSGVFYWEELKIDKKSRKLQVTSTNNGKDVTKTYNFENTESSNEELATFANKINALTNNTIKNVTKVDRQNISDAVEEPQVRFGKSVTFSFADENEVVPNVIKELKNLHSFTSVTHDNLDNTTVHIQGKVATGNSLTPSYVDTDIKVAASEVVVGFTLYDNTDDLVSEDFDVTFDELATIYESNSSLTPAAFFDVLSEKISASNFALTATWVNNILTLSSNYENPVKFYCEYPDFITLLYENTSEENKEIYFEAGDTLGVLTVYDLSIVLTAV